MLRKNGRYRQLYDKQHRIERDRFINPGEDLAPVAPAVREDEGREDNPEPEPETPELPTASPTAEWLVDKG